MADRTEIDAAEAELVAARQAHAAVKAEEVAKARAIEIAAVTKQRAERTFWLEDILERVVGQTITRVDGGDAKSGGLLLGVLVLENGVRLSVSDGDPFAVGPVVVDVRVSGPDVVREIP